MVICDSIGDHGREHWPDEPTLWICMPNPLYGGSMFPLDMVFRNGTWCLVLTSYNVEHFRALPAPPCFFDVEIHRRTTEYRPDDYEKSIPVIRYLRCQLNRVTSSSFLDDDVPYFGYVSFKSFMII